MHEDLDFLIRRKGALPDSLTLRSYRMVAILTEVVEGKVTELIANLLRFSPRDSNEVDRKTCIKLRSVIIDTGATRRKGVVEVEEEVFVLR
jgi:hypothetical protein